MEADTTMTTVIKPIMVEEFLMEKLNLRGGLERMDERGWNKVFLPVAFHKINLYGYMCPPSAYACFSLKAILVNYF